MQPKRPPTVRQHLKVARVRIRKAELIAQEQGQDELAERLHSLLEEAEALNRLAVQQTGVVGVPARSCTYL